MSPDATTLSPTKAPTNGIVSSAAAEKPQRSRTKKPGKALRRPLSAYNLFYKSECEVIKKDIQQDGALPQDYTKNVQAAMRRLKGNRSKAEFQAIASTVGERWKSLPPSQRTKYERQAEDEMKEYKKRKIEYRFALIRECETAAQDFYRGGSDHEPSGEKSLPDASEKSGDSSQTKPESVAVASHQDHFPQVPVASRSSAMQLELPALPYGSAAATLLRAQPQAQPSSLLSNQVLPTFQEAQQLLAARHGGGLALPPVPSRSIAQGLQAELLLRQRQQRLVQEDLELQVRQKQQEVLLLEESRRLALLQNLSAYEQAEKERAARRVAILRASLGLLP